MAIYYISPSGSNTNNGLGPDASAAVNKPWLTVGKAMNTGSTVVAGDTVYIGPGVFYAEALVPIATISSTASPTAFRGDPTNAQGFKDGAGARLAPGLPVVTTRTNAETDGPIASGAVGIDLSTNDVGGLQLYDFVLEAGSNDGVNLDPRRAASFLMDGMRVVSGADCIGGPAQTPTAARNWIIRRSILLGNRFFVMAPSTAAATANADLNILLEGNLMFGWSRISIGTTAGNKAGGLHFRGNTIISGAGFGQGAFFMAVSGGHSTVTTSDFEGNLIIGGDAIAYSADAGCFVDNGYNRAVGMGRANTNVTEAATTKRNVPANLVLPDLVKWGLALPSADMFGWTPDAHTNQKFSAWTNVNADFRNRRVRPWGSGASVGYLEAGLISQDTTSAITGGGVNSLKLTGAGELSLFVPVAASATTITVVTKSSLYGGASYPQLIMEANPALGITQTTGTATDASEQTLTVGPFTPTAAGVVELRLIARSSATNSATWFDLLAAA